MRGKFINIEGLDGCGKSTNVKLLANWLLSIGRKVIITNEPTDGPIGKVIKKVLMGKLKIPVEAEALLFASDRLHHIVDVINPALQSGKIVLNERYTPSSLAYQSARGLSIGWIKIINRHALKPNLNVLIDVLPGISFGRISRSRKLDEFERDFQLQKKVRQNYLQIAEQTRMMIVNGSLPMAEVQVEIRNLVKDLL